MKQLILIFTLLAAYSFASAQSFKVLKIQGDKAIVEVDDIDLVELNKVYSTGNTPPVAAEKNVKSVYKRNNSIGFNFNFTSSKSDAPGAVSTSNIILDGNYLWNFKKYEIGPLLSYSNLSGGGATTTSTALGGLGLYNFNDNKPGVAGVFSILGQISLGASSTGGASSSLTSIKIGPNYRWFLLSGDHCFSATAVFQMDKSSASGLESTTTGFGVIVGISTYF